MAGANYAGEGLAVSITESGAQLHCVFQRLEGLATRDGLWLVSMVTNQPHEPFQLKAARMGRGDALGSPKAPIGPNGTTSSRLLKPTGEVTNGGQAVLFTRSGLIERYSVSLDGVRQDFVIGQRPPGEGQLRVELSVSGAHVETAPYGIQLVLKESGRKIAYSNLRVTDTIGKELVARMEVASDLLPEVKSPNTSLHKGYLNQDSLSEMRAGSSKTEPGFGAVLGQERMNAVTTLALVVDDAQAVYPFALTRPSAMPIGSAWADTQGQIWRCTRPWWMVQAIST